MTGDFASVSSQFVHGLESFCPLDYLFAERVKCFELFWDRLNLEAIQDTSTGHLISVEPNMTVVTHIVCLFEALEFLPEMWVFRVFYRSEENFLLLNFTAVTCFLSNSRSQLQQGNSALFSKLFSNS